MEYRTTPGRLQIGDFSLYYERTGSGPALVFLHGLGGNHLSWWQQVPYFMRHYECITVDQRSFGLSPDPEGLFNRAHASDLARLLDHLKIDRAALVGQSMGGWTIVGCALEQPERIAAMVMADTPGGIFTPNMKFERTTPLPVDSSPALGSLPTYAADYFARKPDWAFLYDELRILGARPPADAGPRIITQRYDLVEVRERLRMPVLCLVGELDVLITPEMVREVARTLPAGRFASVPDCGHSVYFENAGVFNQLVRDFLNEVKFSS
jgi:3-oxoadipate enol-lactonase